MDWFRELGRRLSILFRRGRFDADVDEEMRLHRELREQEQVERGLSPKDAHYAAQRHFGNDLVLREESRDMWGWNWLENLLQDIRYGLRMLAKNPGFTSVAVITLALGIGANTAIFSVVNAVLLRPLPYAKPERLVRIYSEFPTFPNGGLRRFPVSNPEYLDLKRETKSWESIDGWENSGVNLASKSEPIRATASFVTGGLLRTLGVAPASGRLITTADDDPGAPLVTDVSYGLWQRAFGADPNIVGRGILLNGKKCTVIGVMPKEFRFPLGEVDAPDVWSPLQINPANPGGRASHSLSLLGRLKPEVTLSQAQAEFDSLVRQLAKTGSASGHQFHPTAHTIVSYGLQDEVVREIRPALRMLLGAVCFVLLIACVNVASLLLARSETRQREIAVREATGASLMRLTLQFVTEGILLSAVGAVLGLGFADAGLQLVKATGEARIPRAPEIAIDAHVFLFAVATCALAGVFFGLTPLAHVARQNLHDALKSAAASTTGGTLTQRFRQVLVVSELAMALVLLVGTGLMVRAFWKVRHVNAGFEPDDVVTAFVALPEAIYGDNQAIVNFWKRLEQRLAELPGIEGAALVSGLPPAHGTSYADTEIEGFVYVPGGPLQSVDFYQIISKNYFKTMGIRLIEGRLFEERDAPGTPPVVIVNQTMARTFWGNQSPIGRRIREDSTNPWWTVIGVVADVKNAGIEKPTGTELYILFNQFQAQGRNRDLYVAVRSTGNLAAAVSAMRRNLHDLDPALPLANVRTMDDIISAAQSRPRFLTILLTLFSIVALVLAAVGIYGVISYSVAQRTKEFGIRLAFGARQSDVLKMTLAGGSLLIIIGILAGLSGALLVTRFLSSLLFGVTPTDPLTLIGVSLLLSGVAFFACYIPARRATKVDPIVALRYE